MNKKLLTLSLIAIFTLGIFNFYSCDENETLDPDLETIKANAKGAYIVSDAFSVACNNANTASSRGDSDYPDGMTIENNPTGFVVTFKKDTELNGTKRTGKIIVVQTGKTWKVGSALTITFKDYIIDGETVSGSITAKFSETTQDYRLYKVAAVNLKTAANGEENVVNMTIDIKQTAGFDTPLTLSDDRYEINGGGEGTNADKENYKVAYAGIVVKGDCQWPMVGTIAITKDKTAPFTIDFDTDGENCNNEAKVNQGLISTTIKL